MAACLLAITATVGVLHSASHSITIPELHDDVRVYISRICPMAGTVRASGEATARELLSKAGVGLRFTSSWQANPSERVIQLWILDRAPANVKSGVLGAAFSARHDLQPVVFIFYDRVIQLASVCSSSNRETGIVLGHVIAHELGHVLGEIDHSPEGLMQTNWSEQDVRNMLRGRFGFNSTDSTRMRRAMAERTLASVNPGVQ